MIVQDGIIYDDNSMANLVTSEQCEKNHSIIARKMDELTQKIDKVIVAIASLPGDLTDKFDNKYAPKSLEADVEKLKEGQNVKMWDIIKIVVTALVMFLIGYF